MIDVGSQLYSPVSVGRDGNVTVELAGDHPGFADPEYRRRRDEIAALSHGWTPGTPIPVARYTDREHEVWSIVCRELEGLHERFADQDFLAGKDQLGLPSDHVPQLSEVTERLAPLTGFRYLPVAGLAPLRDFYGAFEHRAFYSTQYVRHHSLPLYTPEPDVIHEVLGHANQLADPTIAAMYTLVGAAVQRCRTEQALRFLSKVFWFTFEFGVLRERGELRAYGAGILSSTGETLAFRQARIRPLDLVSMGTARYDITHYQPVLYAAESKQELLDLLTEFLTSYDDDAYLRLTTTR